MSASHSSDTAVIDASFQAEAFEALDLTVPGAHVYLRPHDEDDRVHLRGSAPGVAPEEARTLFDRKGISTHQSGDRLHVFGEAVTDGVDAWRWRHHHETAVQFEVQLPPDLDVTTDTPGGSVEATDLSGTLSARVQSGAVTARGLRGPLEVRGSGGALSVQDCDGPSVDLRWSAGEVSLRNLTADSTALRAAAGPTTAKALHGPTELLVHGASLSLEHLDGPCDAEVRGGTLTYRGAPSAETTLRAVGGPLHTHLPPSQAASLILTGAHVDLDERFAFEGERTAHRIEGTLNGGGPPLRLRAVQGRAECGVQTEA